MIAYFCMELGLDQAMPTYSGGLGVLAGDMLQAAADLRIPMAGVTLLHRKGHFRQRLDAAGHQTEDVASWSPEALLQPMPARTVVPIEGRAVHVRPWRLALHGPNGHVVPVYFLDTDLPDNAPQDRSLTDFLYGGDGSYRLAQEAVLGFGGVALLRAMGHEIRTYHMNEGHTALIVLALLEERTRRRGLQRVSEADMQAIRERCVFTTHTPVAAGHDQFPLEVVRTILGPERAVFIEGHPSTRDGLLNMTDLALYFSRYVNGVSMRHGETLHTLHPHHSINAISNGVHAVRWAAPSFRRLYDRYFPRWRRDHQYLRYAIDIPLEEIRQAHAEAKDLLRAEIQRRTGVSLKREVLTIGFARRATGYKRADLLFADPERLRGIVGQVGPLQVVYAGKAHSRDDDGKHLIRRVFEAAAALGDAVPVLYLEDYDVGLAAQICAGVDVWLNTPLKPREASGTSGMKAALNGVPSFSVLDGWWPEGHIEGVTGWAIGDERATEADPAAEIASLYEKLERDVLPTFYGRPEQFARMMRCAIAMNGAYFNAHRMVFQYAHHAYGVGAGPTETPSSRR
jgi:starch phosphorylase